MKRATPILMLVSLCLSSLPAAAAETSEAMLAVTPALAATQPGPPAAALDYRVKRPAILPALYASFGAVQVWDVHSTSVAMQRGAREANAVMAPFAGHPAQMIAIKAAATAGTVFFVERLWKHNRVAAVVVMAAINGATAAVAMNNVRNARRSR